MEGHNVQNIPPKLLRTGCSQNVDICLHRYHGCEQPHRLQGSSLFFLLQRTQGTLARYSCTDVCMESARKYWIPVFNVLEKSCNVVLTHPKYTKPQRGNKTYRKDAKWICDLFMCDMIKPSFIPPAYIRQLRDLMCYREKLTNCLTGEKNRAQNCLTVSNLKLDDVFSDVFCKSTRSITEYILSHPGRVSMLHPLLTDALRSRSKKFRPL